MRRRSADLGTSKFISECTGVGGTDPLGKSFIDSKDSPDFLDEGNDDEDLESVLLKHRNDHMEAPVPRCRGQKEASLERVAETQQSATTAVTAEPRLSGTAPAAVAKETPPPPPKARKEAKKAQLSHATEQRRWTTDAAEAPCGTEMAQSARRHGTATGATPIQAAEARASTAWRIIYIHGHGLGLVSTRNIARGELVMEERPLLKTSPPFKVDTEAHNKWIRKVVALELSAEDRRDFMNLCCVTKERTAEGIFKINTFGVRGSLDVVYRDISRMNHSCYPNCAHSWDDVRCVGQIRALRMIDPAEELLLTYTDLCTSCVVRKAYLADVYGFQCDCPSCEDGSDISDFRRQAIRHCAELLQPHGMIVQIFSRASEDIEKHREDDLKGMSRAEKQKEKRMKVARAKKIIADAEQARELGLRLAVQLLRLVQAERLDGVDDVAAHACEAAAFLLMGHRRQQQLWSQECLERIGIGGSSVDVAWAENALWTTANQPKNNILTPVTLQGVEAWGDPRQALTFPPEALIEPSLFEDTKALLVLCDELAESSLVPPY